MAIGQAYKKVLTQRVQEILAAACRLLIDRCFDALEIIEEPEDIVYTIFSVILPERYTYKYMPLFFYNGNLSLLSFSSRSQGHKQNG